MDNCFYYPPILGFDVLHVYGYDGGGAAGFLGNFSLSGSDHVFSNKATFLETNTTNWQGNASGFGNTYLPSLMSFGKNDTSSIWGQSTSVNGGIANISSTATWIWTGGNPSYFSTKISAVSPVPEAEEWAMMLLGLPLMGFVVRRKKALLAA